MINWRIKDFNSPPDELIKATSLVALREAELARDGDYVKSYYYNCKEVNLLLKAYSIGKTNFHENIDKAKCFYCESFCDVVASLQVEHYRPKKVVHDEHRKTIGNGYFWLGIEWSNLVLACPKCNGRGAKGNIFTIEGIRSLNQTSFDNLMINYNRNNCIADSEHLLAELPHLLHPEIDDAYNFLNFNDLGEISSIELRGIKTIKYCKLDRSQLNIARFNIIERFNIELFEVIEWVNENLIRRHQVKGIWIRKCKKIRKCNDRTHAYSLFMRNIIEKFETFFVLKVPFEYQDELREAFEESI